MGFRTYILVFLFFWPSFTEASTACREALDEPISLYELAKARTQYMDALREAKRAGDLSSLAVFEAAELLSWRLFRRYEVELRKLHMEPIRDEAMADQLREMVFFRLIRFYQHEKDYVSSKITNFSEWLNAQHRRLMKPDGRPFHPTELEARQHSFAEETREELYLVWQALQKLSERHQKALYIHWGISYFSFDEDGAHYTLLTQEDWSTEEKLEKVGVQTLAGVAVTTRTALEKFEVVMRQVLLDRQSFEALDKPPPLLFLETWFEHRLLDSGFLWQLQFFDFFEWEEESGLAFPKQILFHRFGLSSGTERSFRTIIQNTPIRDPARISHRLGWWNITTEETRKALHLTLARLYELHK